jgi:hypothetical protein
MLSSVANEVRRYKQKPIYNAKEEIEARVAKKRSPAECTADMEKLLEGCSTLPKS